MLMRFVVPFVALALAAGMQGPTDAGDDPGDLSTSQPRGHAGRAAQVRNDDNSRAARESYLFPVPRYPGYGPPPGGGWGYRRGYSANPPAYPEYRRRGGGYRQHRQYANPPLFPVPGPRNERSLPDGGTVSPPLSSPLKAPADVR